MLSDSVSCRICLHSNAQVTESGGTDETVTCPRCGTYLISAVTYVQWDAHNRTDKEIANASGWIRERPGIEIIPDDIEHLLHLQSPSVAERADKLLLFISQQHKKTGSAVYIPLGAHLQEWLGVSWSQDEEEITYLVRGYLKDGMEWLKTKSPVGSDLVITAKGYQHLEEIRRKPVDSDIGFCAMWFDPSVKQVWTDAIEPAIRNVGYLPKRIDSHEHNNRIDDEIIVMIRRSKFVVADFTGQRGGVYFEAGFARGLGLEVVWTCSKEELDANKIHFDNRQYSFVTWEPGKLDDFKRRLQNRIESTIGKGPGRCQADQWCPST